MHQGDRLKLTHGQEAAEMTNRRRRARTTAQALSLPDWGALTVGCGCAYWTEAERERLRQLWQIHGPRLMNQDYNGEPWGLLEFGQPEVKR